MTSFLGQAFDKDELHSKRVEQKLTNLYSSRVCLLFFIVHPLVSGCPDISIKPFLLLSEDCFVFLIVAKSVKVYFPMSVSFNFEVIIKFHLLVLNSIQRHSVHYLYDSIQGR